MTAWMLELGRAHWRLSTDRDDAPAIGVVNPFAPHELASCPSPIHEALVACGYRGEPLQIALGSDWCLSATLTLSRPRDARDRQAMLYRLEEWIPWSAEDCVCDYLTVGEQVFMVAVPKDPLAHFFADLESRGVVFQSIVPAALLAANAHLEQNDPPAEHTVVFAIERGVDLVQCASNRPRQWSWLSDLGALRQELTANGSASGQRPIVVAYGLGASDLDELTRNGLAQLAGESSYDASEPVHLAFGSAQRILAGATEPWVELKRGAFGASRGYVALRRYRSALAATVVLLVVAVAGALLYRGHEAGRRAEELSAEQVAVFRQALPNTRVPVGLKSRLESELAKLQGLEGNDAELSAGTSATMLLQRLLAAAPTDRRFRLLEIRIEAGVVYLDGEVRDHGDAEAMALRLRSLGFEVSPPRTQRLDDQRVSLRIKATTTNKSSAVVR